jgi:Mn-dependent DtxR family transcriptional regulator
MNSISLEEDYAIVLQIIDENGQEDFEYLAETLRLDRHQLANILQSLQHEKLIYITPNVPYSRVSLSSRGRRLVGTMWPESKLLHHT